MAIKHLYKGTFLFNHSAYILRCYAYSGRQALILFCRQIAKKQGLENVGIVYNYLSDRNDYEITKEIEFKEDDAA